ncbi:MAG TPA: hypothetical protein VFH73_09195 [Polyangia bacterium]|nr:hypothetical protein [Polyangia bacterium]
MAMFAIAVPILQGKTETFERFIGELKGARFAEFQASRKRLEVRERTFFQKTPMGDFVVVTLEGSDPSGAFQKFAAGNDAFTQWFAKQVKEIHGFDLTAPPPGPLPELIVDSAG